jgi:hypothetical protein
VKGTEMPPIAIKSDWKRYDTELKERKGKIAEFIIRILIKEQLLKEI